MDTELTIESTTNEILSVCSLGIPLDALLIVGISTRTSYLTAFHVQSMQRMMHLRLPRDMLAQRELVR